MTKYLALFLFLVGGCSTLPQQTDYFKEARLAFNPYDRVGDRPTVLNTAGTTGVLDTSSSPCLTIRSRSRLMTPLWPEGTVYDISAGSLHVVLPDGRGRAQVGKLVHLAGSTFASTQVDDLEPIVREECPGPFFAVSTIDMEK